MKVTEWRILLNLPSKKSLAPQRIEPTFFSMPGAFATIKPLGVLFLPHAWRLCYYYTPGYIISHKKLTLIYAKHLNHNLTRDYSLKTEV